MDTKEEMIDDINEVEDITPDKKIEEVVENLSNEPKQSVPAMVTPEPVIDLNVNPRQEPVIPDANNTISTATSNPGDKQIIASNTTNMDEDSLASEVKVENKEEVKAEETKQEEQEAVKPKKRKAPIIVLLSILLVLDVAALVIYIIGIDKVLSFIK